MSPPRIGLALGAGGTKGVAHVGVLKVLQEAGIPIDCVAGASVGALYAAGYAIGRPVESMARGTRRSSPWQVFRFFWHGLSLRHDNPVARAYLRAFQGHRCEELRVPFAAVASDVEEASPVVLREGDLVRALEASIAILWLARPVPWEGRWLVDGGFWESAPVSAAAALGAERVIAVVLGDPLVLPRWLRPLVRWLAEGSPPSGRRTSAGPPGLVRLPPTHPLGASARSQASGCHHPPRCRAAQRQFAPSHEALPGARRGGRPSRPPADPDAVDGGV